MIKLNDYLYNGDTVLKILHNYTADLHQVGWMNDNPIDEIHAGFLEQITDLLEHNEFLTNQSQRIRDFYMYMARQYPYLAFIFKGRIKSLIRAEEKFNGYIVEYIYDHYMTHGSYPSIDDLKNRLRYFRDLIAYRIVISMPECHLAENEDHTEIEKNYLYEIANALVPFMIERGFTPEPANEKPADDRLNPIVRPYFKDFIANTTPFGYQSLHITFYDNNADCYIEMQLRTKDMDDIAEIGPANHLGYEKRQEAERRKRDTIPVGENTYFDDAYERGLALQQLALKDVRVNMFAAFDNSLINDGCGLYRGRVILPYEHLSRFQNDLIE